MQRTLYRELAAEFLGTFVLIVFGCGSVAQVLLSGQKHGEYLSINIGWGLGVMLGVYVAGGVTGAHLNPAVTLALAVWRRFPRGKILPYCGAQLVGAFVASVVVYVTYRDALDVFDGGVREVLGSRGTAGIWATYPQPFLTPVIGGLLDQIVGTALLILCVFALSDPRNLAPVSHLTPVLVGATVLAIGIAFGYNSGYAINPARDLGPRLFTFVAGWGADVFRAGHSWWWVPIAGPLIGGVLGGGLYDLLITRWHPEGGN
ncbi:MAG: MIP family channel protein [Pirellulaceae bacterium]|jgi:MIP family channel proteins|nr:MIP family channel protein [Pirellulaceae bacterium]